MSLARKVFSGTAQLTFSNGLVRLLSIATMPFLTAMLSPDVYGLTNLVGTVVSLISVVVLMGLDMSYARAYFSSQPPNGITVEHYCWRLAFGVTIPIAVLCSVAWWYGSQKFIELNQQLSPFIALGIIASVANTMASTRARLAANYRAMSWSIVLSGFLCSGISIAIALWWRKDVLALLIPMVLSYLLPVLILGTPSLISLLKSSLLSTTQKVALVNIGLAGVITAPMYWLLSSSDRWFLQYFHGANLVGIYSIGYNVAMIGMMINNAVTSVWLPEATREFEADHQRAQVTLGRLMSRLIVIMGCIWLAVTAAGGDIVHWLANERFYGAVDVIPYVAGAVFFNGVLQLANAGLLLKKKLKWALFWWLGGGGISIILNLFLIPEFNSLGAALTQVLSFGFIALGILFSSQVFFPLRMNWGHLIVTMVIIILAGIVMMPAWNAVPTISLLMKVPAGMVVVLIVMLIIANDWVKSGIRYLARRVGY